MHPDLFLGGLDRRHRQMRGRVALLKSAAIILGMIAVTPPTIASAQQSGSDGTPVSVDPGAGDPAAQAGAISSADGQPMDTRSTANNPGNPQAYQDVYVDGEKHSWRPLEGDTQRAWEAYRNGDYQTAVPIFSRLAKLGHPVAQWLMGNVYYAGQGVPQDYSQALVWFEKAANQGYMPAYAPTARLYEDGKGTPVDTGKAYLWYNVAIASLPYSVERYGLMKQRDALANLMTPYQIDAAQKRSISFKPHKVVPPDIEQAREILGQ
jgi:TPR repeat protein